MRLFSRGGGFLFCRSGETPLIGLAPPAVTSSQLVDAPPRAPKQLKEGPLPYAPVLSPVTSFPPSLPPPRTRRALVVQEPLFPPHSTTRSDGIALPEPLPGIFVGVHSSELWHVVGAEVWVLFTFLPFFPSGSLSASGTAGYATLRLLPSPLTKDIRPARAQGGSFSPQEGRTQPTTASFGEAGPAR